MTGPKSDKVPPDPDQSRLLPPDASQCDPDVTLVKKLAPARLCPRSEARPTGYAGNKGNPRCQRMNGSSPHHFEGTTPLLRVDGNTVLTEKMRILKCWTEHFRRFLNWPCNISDEAINRLPQVEPNADLDLLPILQDTIGAMEQLSSG
ncbi:unnamed protein product [Schistocephalus solidus]|uniref:BTB domain-containing protein n=1 Tax=Schistocephalus solidus TaxID=70667 RepID=A0A183TFU8_SCHSO|nr:unnamed protein product [Schistocephalus solidus]